MSRFTECLNEALIEKLRETIYPTLSDDEIIYRCLWDKCVDVITKEQWAKEELGKEELCQKTI